jgi:AAA family ATP:ADP antiporter
MQIKRAARLLGEVRPGEGLLAFVLGLTIFLILSGYYVLKTVREGLILTGGMLGLGGDELKTYATAASAVLLIGVVPLYGALASRVGRLRLINVCYLVVIGCLAGFFALGQADAPVGFAFYLWLGVVNVFLIAQFWSFANDLYTEAQGKRLFAIIALGGSAGAILGPRLAQLGDTFPMMLLAAAMLGACLVLFHLADRLARARAPRQAELSRQPLAPSGGFRLVLGDRYLFLIAVMLILLNLINTTGEFILSNAVTAYAASVVPDGDEDARREVIKAFYAELFMWVNLLGFLIQAFLVSRVMRYLGIRAALFVLPVIALAGYGMIGVVGGIALIRAVKMTENATDYSLQNTVRQALFLPTSREAKYKAKAAIDTFFVRFGDLAAALLVAFALHVAHLTPRQLAMVNVGLAIAWIAVAAGIARRHRRLSREHTEAPPGAVPAPA